MPIGQLAHTHFPYCIQKTADGKWLVLNRSYKPLGVVSKDWVDYDSHPDRVPLDHRSVAALTRIAVYEMDDEEGNPVTIFFYKDGQRIADTDEGWSTYAAVLQVLGQAKVK